MSTDRVSIPLAPASASCAGDPLADENRGIICYVRDETEAQAALAGYAQLEDPPDCCRLRTRQLTQEHPDEHPRIVSEIVAHTGTWPLPLTVVDGKAVVAGRLPDYDELVQFTSGKTLEHAPGLLPQ